MMQGYSRKDGNQLDFVLVYTGVSCQRKSSHWAYIHSIFQCASHKFMCNVHYYDYYGCGWMCSPPNRFNKVCLCQYLEDRSIWWLLAMVNESACRVASLTNGLTKWGWSQPLTTWLRWWDFKYEPVHSFFVSKRSQCLAGKFHAWRYTCPSSRWQDSMEKYLPLCLWW